MPSNAICGWPKSQLLEMKTWIRICCCNLPNTLSLSLSFSFVPSLFLSLFMPLPSTPSFSRSICHFARAVQKWKPLQKSAFGFARTLPPFLLFLSATSAPLSSPQQTLQTSWQMSKWRWKTVGIIFSVYFAPKLFMFCRCFEYSLQTFDGLYCHNLLLLKRNTVKSLSSSSRDHNIILLYLYIIVRVFKWRLDLRLQQVAVPRKTFSEFLLSMEQIC